MKGKDTWKSEKWLYSCNTQCILVCGAAWKKRWEYEAKMETRDERQWISVFPEKKNNNYFWVVEIAQLKHLFLAWKII